MDEDSSSFHGGYWKQNLYLLQEKAPKPRALLCKHRIVNKPPFYGDEFHGLIERIDAEQMLSEIGEGAYLVRASKRSADAYTLCMIFDGNVLNYKLYYDGSHYGVRCGDCGFAAHKKCSDHARHDCVPEAKYVKRMFAVDLTTLCIAHSVRIPPVLTKCINEVESRGLKVEGIYRVSGSHEQMERLKRQFDMGQNVDLSTVEDIHTVAGLLKMYLRQLPQQLVPFSVFRSLLNVFSSTRNTRERIKCCRKALEELNESNAYTLHYLLAHLQKVSQNCNENKMSAENLATIFSPTIFCTGSTPSLPHQQHVLLHFLIVTPSVVPYI